MLDLQAEQHDAGQSCLELYEAVAGLKRRHDLHPCAVRPRDGRSGTGPLLEVKGEPPPA